VKASSEIKAELDRDSTETREEFDFHHALNCPDCSGHDLGDWYDYLETHPRPEPGRPEPARTERDA
jgi:hypothetical protein